jgi:putative copper resistance protein D
VEGALAWALPAARALHDTALTLLFGGLLFPLYALRPRERGFPAPLRTALRVEAWAAALTVPALFVLTVGGMAGSLTAALDPALLATTATSGEFGWLSLARTAVLLLCALVVMIRPGADTAVWLAGLALASLALTGHAREGEGWPSALHIALDAVHLLCAGLWIGALPWFGAILSDRYAPDTALAAVRRFSGVAAGAVVLLLLTGLGATLLLVGTPLALPGTTWGRLIIAKIVLAGLMVALASQNRWRSTPGLAAGDARAAHRLRRNAKLELLLSLIVLAVVGWVGTLPFTASA